MKHLLWILLITTVSAIPGQSATLNVPGTYPTIQDAINAAVAGDEVLVAPGTYNETINFMGKAITVTSSGGAAATVIDGGKAGSVVSFVTGEGLGSVLDGFTIINGQNGAGPGIFCNGASPSILNNVITLQTGAAGLGVASIGGGPLIQGNEIHGNAALVLGGAIYLDNTTAHVEGNHFHDNSAGGAGGAVNITGGNPVVTRNVIHDNHSTIHGGGIHCASSTPLITNNLIYDNTADANGGGIFCDSAAPTLVCNTLYKNEALGHGGGIGADGTSAPVVSDCILWDDFAPFGIEIWVNSPNATITVDYSIVMYGYAGTGNLDEDPLFVDAANRDLHLAAASPCINRGTNAGAPLTDIDGDTRPAAGVTDMGADEFTGHLALTATAYTIPESTGGAVDMNLDATPTHGNRNYLVLTGLTGTYPGTVLPKGLATLPLNWDVFTNIGLSLINTPMMAGFAGNLDGQGLATAKLDTLGPLPGGSAGITLYFAFMCFHPFDFVSNSIAIEIVP